MSQIDNIPEGREIKGYWTEEQSSMISPRFCPLAEYMEIETKISTLISLGFQLRIED